MAKGLFTQGVCVLLSEPVSLDAIAPLLSELSIAKRIDHAPNPDMGGPSFTVPFAPEVNGYVNVDVQDRPWPDHMGDAEREPRLFGAWAMGHFGPLTFPGNLRRAVEQAWSWKGAGEAAEQHRAFVRVRSSYVFGAPGDGPVLPPGYDALAELQFVTRVARALLRHPSALAYFDPAGEVLRSDELLADSLAYHAEHGLPPLAVWSNVRLFNPRNGWLVMDTVGMGQLDRPDCEAWFAEGRYEPGEVDRLLRNVSHYLLTKGEVIQHLDTMDGPGGVRWRAHHVEGGLSPPPRRVLRWLPEDGLRPPPEMAG